MRFPGWQSFRESTGRKKLCASGSERAKFTHFDSAIRLTGLGCDGSDRYPNSAAVLGVIGKNQQLVERFSMSLYHWMVIVGTSVLAGMINSVAGGGTLLTFPTLVWLGQSPVVANATNTVALWPGSLGGMWGYREELGRSKPQLFMLMIPSFVGGIMGAVLLKLTPPGVFARLVPFLILFATLLFMVQGAVQRWLRLHGSDSSTTSPHWLGTAFLFQFAVAVYGGYFGAGIGILMLAVLGLFGLTDIHQMNGLKNLFAMCINGVAAIYFMFVGLVEWRVAAVMAVGAIVGGYGSAGIARWLGPRAVRRIVIGIGLAMTISLLIKQK
jgi:uncharacterized protein